LALFAQLSTSDRYERGLENPVAMHWILCPVPGAHITLVTDLEGMTTQVICPEYEESGGM